MIWTLKYIIPIFLPLGWGGEGGHGGEWYSIRRVLAFARRPGLPFWRRRVAVPVNRGGNPWLSCNRKSRIPADSGHVARGRFVSRSLSSPRRGPGRNFLCTQRRRERSPFHELPCPCGAQQPPPSPFHPD